MKSPLYDQLAANVQTSINNLEMLAHNINMKKKMGYSTAEDENTLTKLKIQIEKQVNALKEEGYTFTIKAGIL